jgi:hypothetical protein
MSTRLRTFFAIPLSIFWIGFIVACRRASPKISVKLPELPPLPTEAILRENVGKICFRNLDNSLELQGLITSGDCASSSCWRPIQQVGAVTLLSDEHKIKFQSRFVMVDAYGDGKDHLCTMDCGGSGSIGFNIGDVEEGTYSIWLGDTYLGDIAIPPRFITGEYTCLSSKVTATPLPTLRPTATPVLNPTPYPPPASENDALSNPQTYP